MVLDGIEKDGGDLAQMVVAVFVIGLPAGGGNRVEQLVALAVERKRIPDDFGNVAARLDFPGEIIGQQFLLPRAIIGYGAEDAPDKPGFTDLHVVIADLVHLLLPQFRLLGIGDALGQVECCRICDLDMC